MTQGWHSLRVRPAGDRDLVAAALFAAGSQGLHEDGDSLVTHFPPETDLEAVRTAVRGADAAATIEVTETPDVDWSEAWKHGIGAHELGGLAVVPPWLAEGRDPATTIVIDPAMAFGTGEHQTTRCVVRLMQAIVRAGDSVADLGAGSAVLAIGAAKLGAARVVAIDIDPEAIENAEQNVERNGVADRVTVIEGDAGVLLPLVAPVRVVLANIISSVLVQLLPAIRDALADDGRAILSGILFEERAHMLAVLADEWRVEDEAREGQWWSVAIARR
ncbi:MAG TPA: 50S ribosomal protein L11 methyltransferase [Gemmatimonadaceae bacterium]|nr:50S ribosomal protein L11 methyltransferase [Gemmatimonadaceae bacterium]